ncbi:MAG: phage major capsid protein [Desulfobacterales bacterium]|nr:phage major capsid protein [Desulfobacterales bacterium]
MELQLLEKDSKFYLDTGALEKAIREGTVQAIKDEVKSALDIEKKEIFTGGDGNLMDKEGKTVVDTSYFYKDFLNKRGGPVDGATLGKILSASGGPFLRLSPVMQKFAEHCKQKFSSPFGLQDWNKEVMDWNKKDTMSGLTTTDAGALVPIEFLATVIEFATAQSAILPKLWRIPMGSMTTRIPQLSQSAGSYFGGIVLYHPDELTSKTVTEPSLTYKEFTAKKLIGLCPLSDELVMDSAISIINYITGVFVRAFQYKTESEVIAGTGLLGQMTGILSDAAINLVGRTTLNQVKYDDILNLESAIDENFVNLTWLTRRATVNYLRKQKDTVGQPVYRDLPPYGGQALPILDYPVVKTRNVPLLGLKGDIILGDLSFYMWAVRQEMTIDLSKERYFEYDATAIRFVMRQDGKPGVSIAFAVLNSAPES